MASYKPFIEIVTKKDCKYCKLAIKLLKEKECNWIKSSKPPRKCTFPQIYVDNIFIGGYSELLKYNELWDLSLFSLSKTYKPFRYPTAVEIASTHEMVHWVEAEISLTDDIMAWNSQKISSDEKAYTMDILRLFTQSDVSVGQLYYETFIPLFRNNELRMMMGSFAAREGIHQKAYAMLIDTLGIPEDIYSSFLSYKEMSDKMDFMVSTDTETLYGIGLSLVKAVFNEGVCLFASFLMLLNYQRFGKMLGMGKVVEWSIRDESLHVMGMAYIFRTLKQNYPFIMTPEFEEKVYNLANHVLELEFAFVDLVFKVTREHPDGTLKIPSLTATETKDYIRYILDIRLDQLGFAKITPNLKCPTPWILWIINGTDHTNFFDSKVTEYDVAGLSGDWKDAYI